MEPEWIDPRLGRMDDHGVMMPITTVSGAVYDPASAPARTGLSNGYFVVLDAFGAPDADTLAELEALVAPKSAHKKAKTDESA